jgi:hypothetical protein
MSSSSKITKSSINISRLSPMERHQLSNIAMDFDEKLITGKCKKTLKSHRWASKSHFLADISSKSPNEILDLPLSHFGLCDILSINEIMDENSNHISYTQKAAVNELFKIKYAKKMYLDKIDEDIMRDMSKTKLYKLKKEAEENKKWEKKWGDRLRLAELGISTDPSASASVADTTVGENELSLEKRFARLKESNKSELSLEARLAKLNDPNAKGLKSIKRRGTKRRGTKRRGTKRRRSKSRR